ANKHHEHEKQGEQNRRRDLGSPEQGGPERRPGQLVGSRHEERDRPRRGDDRDGSDAYQGEPIDEAHSDRQATATRAGRQSAKGSIWGYASAAISAAPSRAARSLSTIRTGICSSRLVRRPFAVKARMKPPSARRSAIRGAMPPPRNTPPVAMNESATLPA